MRRLRPTDRSEQVVADWSTTAPTEHKRRMAELLRSLGDGRWESRWWWQENSANPEVIEIRPDEHVHVFIRIEVDESDHCECADIFSIENSASM